MSFPLGLALIAPVPQRSFSPTKKLLIKETRDPTEDTADDFQYRGRERSAVKEKQREIYNRHMMIKNHIPSVKLIVEETSQAESESKIKSKLMKLKLI